MINKTLLLLAWFGLSSNAAPSLSLLASLHFFTPKNEEFAVEVWERHGKPLDRFVRISCLSGCVGRVRLEEEVSDFPMGLMAMEGGNLVVTTWSGATSTFARAYEVKSRSIRKVLDSYSKIAPTVIQSDEPGLTVVLYQKASLAADPALPLQKRLWRWNGSNGAWIE